MENKNILITGAARGIGLEFARMGLSSGARVIMSDVDMETGRIEERKLQVETALNPITKGGGHIVRFFAYNPIRRGLGVAQIADFSCM